MNLATLQAECGRLLADANNGRWTTDILTTRINFAQTEIQGYTNAVKQSVGYNVTAGNNAVTLSTNLLNLIYVKKTNPAGEATRIPILSEYAVDFRYPNWRQLSQGEPQLCWFEATYNKIRLVPTPDATFAATTFAISTYESITPADLVNLTDIPFDGFVPMVPYHMAIVHWVVSQCWMDDGSSEALGKSKFHKSGDILKPGQYELQLKRINEAFDVQEDEENQLLWTPQGGRIGSWGAPSKAFPLS